MEYIIRSAKKSDVSKIIDLARRMVKYSTSPWRGISDEAVQEFREKDLVSLYSSLNNPALGIFVAESKEDGRFLGHVISSSSFLESTTGEEQGYIFDLSVEEDLWGTGIAKNLMDMAEEFIRDRGMKYIALNVTSSNRRAVGFYEKMGFVEERKRMIKVLKDEGKEEFQSPPS